MLSWLNSTTPVFTILFLKLMTNSRPVQSFCRAGAPTTAPGQEAAQRATFCRVGATEEQEYYGEEVGSPGSDGKIPINELVIGQVYQGTVVRVLSTSCELLRLSCRLLVEEWACLLLSASLLLGSLSGLCHLLVEMTFRPF